MKKKISKSFKSDLDINDGLLKCILNDKNVHKKWAKYVLITAVNNLNPPSQFDDNLTSEKKITTHRIVNLMNLTEVHEI